MSRRKNYKVQGFDVARFEDFMVLALADQKGAIHTREIPGNEVRPLDVIMFLKDAWRQGFGGGKPGTLMLDGAEVNFNSLVRQFLLESDVIIRVLPAAGAATARKLELALKQLRAGTPAPRGREAQP